MPGRELAERARRAEAHRRSTPFVIPDHLIPQLSPDPDLATVAAATRASPDRHVRPQQRPAPPGGPRPGPRERSTSCRSGRLDVAIGAGWNKPEYDDDRPAVRSGRGPRRPPDRGDRGPQGLLRRRAVQLRRRALHDHRLRRRPEAGPAAAPAVLHRRRRPADADAGRPRGGHRRARAADPVREQRAIRGASPGRRRPRRSPGSARRPAIGSTT